MPCHDGRDLWVQRRDAANGLHRVSELGRTFLPMHYPLMHPNGEDGWHGAIPLKRADWNHERYRFGCHQQLADQGRMGTNPNLETPRR